MTERKNTKQEYLCLHPLQAKYQNKPKYYIFPENYKLQSQNAKQEYLCLHPLQAKSYKPENKLAPCVADYSSKIFCFI